MPLKEIWGITFCILRLSKHAYNLDNKVDSGIAVVVLVDHVAEVYPESAFSGMIGLKKKLIRKGTRQEAINLDSDTIMWIRDEIKLLYWLICKD